MIHEAKMPEAVMPPFSYWDIVTTKKDCLELFIYCCMWIMLEKMINMYVRMPDELARDLAEAGEDKKKRKELTIKFKEYKTNIRDLFNGVFCAICSTYYVFAYGLKVDTWCNGFEYTISTIQVAHFLSDLIMTF